MAQIYQIYKKSKDIPKVLLWIDIIFLIIGIFYCTKWFLLTSLAVNICFIGAYMVIQKYHYVFDTMAKTNAAFKMLNKTLRAIDG